MEENFAEFTGKTVEEAIEEGLAALNLTKEEAIIEVIEEPKKKLFFSSKARVKISKKETTSAEKEVKAEKPAKIKENGEKPAVKEETKPVEKIPFDRSNLTEEGTRTCAFLDGLFERLNLDAVITNVEQNEKLIITLATDNYSSIIGKRGEILDSIQTLAGAVANIGKEEYMRVVVDCENYREKREETLQYVAKKVANKAVKLGRKVKLEPMNPYERRIIHSTLADSTEVKTKSEGKEPNRYVVIIPNNLKPYDPNKKYGGKRPYNGERKPYNKDRRPYDRDRKPYNGERRSGYSGRSSSGGTGTSYGKASYSGSSYKKKTTVLGTFLGNSGNSGESGNKEE